MGKTHTVAIAGISAQADLHIHNRNLWIKIARTRGYTSFAEFSLVYRDFLKWQQRFHHAAELLDTLSMMDYLAESQPVIYWDHLCFGSFGTDNADITFAFKDTETKMEWMLKYG